MKNASRRSAFTLIEVLIVVIIMAVLAATIIPQFTSSTKDAKLSSVRFNLHSIRSQIELYKEQHSAKYPTLAKFSDQMTKATNVNGDTPGVGETSFGPYITGEIPANPFNGSNAVVAATVDSAGIPTGVSGTAGWQYDETRGGFFANDSVDHAKGDFSK